MLIKNIIKSYCLVFCLNNVPQMSDLGSLSELHSLTCRISEQIVLFVSELGDIAKIGINYKSYSFLRTFGIN
jgi:hypothetical protein